MLMHKSSLLLVLPLLLTTLPTSSVKANDLDIQTGSVRVTIDRNTGIRIESARHLEPLSEPPIRAYPDDSVCRPIAVPIAIQMHWGNPAKQSNQPF
jgi:hypothetical protein